MELNIIGKILRDAIRIDRINWPQAPVLTVAHDIDRSYEYQGRWYAPLVSTIEDDLAREGLASVSVARIISRLKGPRAHGRVFSPEGGFARALLHKRIKGVLRRGEYPYSAPEERIWREVLQSTSARVALAIQPSREMCVACHDLGVWVADVQHGVIGDAHPWYGKDFRAQEPADYVPSAFLVWDQESADVMQRWPREDKPELRVIGNRWLRRFNQPAPDDQLVAQALSRLRHSLGLQGHKPVILVTLSWGVDNLDNGFMSEPLIETIRATSDRYHWLVRLHPNQVTGFSTSEGTRYVGFHEQRLGQHASWEAATKAPLPALLGLADLHVCWNSSCCIEASRAGIRSALLDPQLLPGGRFERYYASYRASGHAHVLDTDAQGLQAWIEQNLAARQAPAVMASEDQAYAQLLQDIAQRCARDTT